MSHTSDERFKELAMKLVSFECTPEEKAELRRMVDQNPARWEELKKLCLSVGIARELLPLANALKATEGRMSQGELGALKASLARRRAEQRRAPGASASGTFGASSERSFVVEAQVVPEKSFNGYKLAFYTLLLLILTAGCIALLKSCDPRKETPRVEQKPPAAGEAKVPAQAVEDVVAQQGPQEIPATQAQAAPTQPSTSPQSRLPSYRDSKWVRLHDNYSKPGFSLYFRRFVFPFQSQPAIEGMIGAAGRSPSQWMLFQSDGSKWDVQTFQGLPSEPEFVWSLDATRKVVGARTDRTYIFLIDKGRARRLDIHDPWPINAAHATPSGNIFLHFESESVVELDGAKVTLLEKSHASNFVHRNGVPTGMSRAFVRAIGKADTGDDMGVWYRLPVELGPASLVRFNGKLWEFVCSLGDNYPYNTTHYLTKASMVACLRTRILVVEDGVVATLASPNEFETSNSAIWMAVRAASTDDFVCVDSRGGVYHYFNGQFNQAAAPISAFRESGSTGFQSVMIAPDGSIYGIHGLDKWSSSVIYQLAPKELP